MNLRHNVRRALLIAVVLMAPAPLARATGLARPLVAVDEPGRFFGTIQPKAEGRAASFRFPITANWIVEVELTSLNPEDELNNDLRVVVTHSVALHADESTAGPEAVATLLNIDYPRFNRTAPTIAVPHGTHGDTLSIRYSYHPATLAIRATHDLPSVRLFLVDSSNGGTIYEYNYETNQPLHSFPTPEPADVLGADGLAWAEDRGTLFYINSNGSGRIYELNSETGTVLRSFDSSTIAGGQLTRVEGLGYGDSAAGINALWATDPESGCMFAINPDAPASPALDGFCIGSGFLLGPTAADLDGDSIWYAVDYYPDIDVFTATPRPAFVDWWDAPEMDQHVATGIGQVTLFDGDGSRIKRLYHASAGGIYEYDADNLPFNRYPLSYRPGPPSRGVTAVAAGEADFDADGVPNSADNCPEVPNPDQANACDLQIFACEPKGAPYWRRQCLGIPASEGGLDPGGGQGPPRVLESGFLELIPVVTSRVHDLVYHPHRTACQEWFGDQPPRCEEALEQLKALVFNVESGRLADVCAVDVSSEGCAASSVDGLVEEIGALIRTRDVEPCDQAFACAIVLNGRPPTPGN